MSAFLDEHPEFADRVAADLSREGVSDVGRQGLTHEMALRCGVLKQLRGESCRELAFALRDSATARRFARLGDGRAPGKSALQATVGSVSAETWERVNATLLETACSEGVEDGSQVQVDSTVTETDILRPGKRHRRKVTGRFSEHWHQIAGNDRGRKYPPKVAANSN